MARLVSPTSAVRDSYIAGELAMCAEEGVSTDLVTDAQENFEEYVQRRWGRAYALGCSGHGAVVRRPLGVHRHRHRPSSLEPRAGDRRRSYRLSCRACVSPSGERETDAYRGTQIRACARAREGSQGQTHAATPHRRAPTRRTLRRGGGLPSHPLICACAWGSQGQTHAATFCGDSDSDRKGREEGQH